MWFVASVFKSQPLGIKLNYFLHNMHSGTFLLVSTELSLTILKFLGAIASKSLTAVISFNSISENFSELRSSLDDTE